MKHQQTGQCAGTVTPSSVINGPPLPEIQATEPLPELLDEPERPSSLGPASGHPGTDRWSELAFNTFMRGWPPGVTNIR